MFSGTMVRAILAGRKTQTRRVVTTREPLGFLGSGGDKGPDWNDPAEWGWFCEGRDFSGYAVLKPGVSERIPNGQDRESIPCPYGGPDDRLWVRETHAVVPWLAGAEQRVSAEHHEGVRYRATWDKTHSGKWTPSIFMRRWASRITLLVESAHVERLQDISESDAQAEGMRGPLIDGELDRLVSQIGRTPRLAYSDLWDAINGKRAPWTSNPWVWVVKFSVQP